MPLIDVSTTLVIKEVQRRPVIWDIHNMLYRSKQARKRAWLEVNHALMPNFKDMDNSEKLETDRAIQQRWKTARDAYIRNKAVLRANKNAKKYFYFDLLSFLDPGESLAKKANPPQSPSAGSSDPLEQIQISEFNPQIIPKTESTHSFEYEDENPQPDDTDESDQIEDNESEAEDYLPKKRKLGTPSKSNRNKTQNECMKDEKNQTDVMLKMLKDYMTQMQNDDMAFFMSMLPMVSKLTMQQKLAFRSKLIDTLLELNSKNS